MDMYHALGTGKINILSMPVAGLNDLWINKGIYAAEPVVPMYNLWMSQTVPWGWATTGDSDLQTIWDIKEKGKSVRVAVNQSAPSMIAAYNGLLAYLEITPDDITTVPFGGYTPNCRSIVEGKADVTYVSPISGVTYEMDASPRGLRWLELPLDDPESFARYAPWQPGRSHVACPLGVPSAIGAEMVIDNKFWEARTDFDELWAYNICKWFDQGYDLYKDSTSRAFMMGLSFVTDALPVHTTPMHPGTVQYLKDIGEWTSEYETWNNKTKDLLNKHYEAYKAAVAEAKARGITPSADDETYLEILAKHKEGLPDFSVRQ
jgi:hypothetical protein